MFCGTGSNSAINLLVSKLGLKQQIQTSGIPVVFVSIFEHNSIHLPWTEAGCKIELIGMTLCGDFDYEDLKTRLFSYRGKDCMKICSFSAGSNMTGNFFDTDRIAIMCHEMGALAFFDYTAVG